MDSKDIIRLTEKYVKETLKDAEGGHDWFHTDRVRKLAKYIAYKEDADPFITELGALLHDIADSKFNNGNEAIGPAKASEFLRSWNVSENIIIQIVTVIQHISFKNESENQGFKSKELQAVQDADRLDALGAIGIARAFNYGGFTNRALYDPEIKPNVNQSKEAYKKSTAPTINHFYEKLLLLKDMMNTETGKKLAEERHQFMETYLDRFYKEWNAEF